MPATKDADGQIPTWIVTGGAGFIGSNLVHRIRREKRAKVVTFDLLTYAGNLANLDSLSHDPDHLFVRGDIRDPQAVAELFLRHRPSGVLHLAAESHVDRSIENNPNIIQTFSINDHNNAGASWRKTLLPVGCPPQSRSF